MKQKPAVANHRRHSTLATKVFFNLISIVATSTLSAQNNPNVTYIPKHEELVYTFGGHPAKMHLKPGTTLITWTEDCYDGAVKSPTDIPSKVIPHGHDNPQTGPFYIDGAEPGDALAVHIIKIELLKNARLNWPRIEDDDYIMSTGSYRPLEDAARIAYNDIVRWIATNYSMDLQDAYQLVSQTAETDLTQMVDPNYTVVVKVPKKYLPPGDVMNGMHGKIRGR